MRALAIGGLERQCRWWPGRSRVCRVVTHARGLAGLLGAGACVLRGGIGYQAVRAPRRRGGGTSDAHARGAFMIVWRDIAEMEAHSSHRGSERVSMVYPVLAHAALSSSLPCQEAMKTYDPRQFVALLWCRDPQHQECRTIGRETRAHLGRNLGISFPVAARSRSRTDQVRAPLSPRPHPPLGPSQRAAPSTGPPLPSKETLIVSPAAPTSVRPPTPIPPPPPLAT
jgi:hypothetical protein